MNPLRVTFLGPLASFSHQAAVESFGNLVEFWPRLSFAEAFEAVQNGDADYAIIPSENSSNGAVVQTLDLLVDRNNIYPDVKICGEHYLTVHHCLLARKGAFDPDHWDPSSITKLYTHPQAWTQCDIFLNKYFMYVERQDVSSTSKAGEIVKETTTERSAAIASRFAAEHHGLDVLAENIEDKANNTTRFLILKNTKSGLRAPLEDSATLEKSVATPTAKTLISFMICRETPWALADALLIFKNYGMNLTNINSRPSQRIAWQYVFLVECQLITTEENKDAVTKILNELQRFTENCKYLGTWTDQLTPV